MVVTTIPCQVPGCEYEASGDSEAIAIAKLGNHNSVHLQVASTNRRSHVKPPQIARPEVKQDISAEEWYSFLEEWNRFKRLTNLSEDEAADQLLQ